MGVEYRHSDENVVSIDRFSNKFNELLPSLNYEKKTFIVLETSASISDFHENHQQEGNTQMCKYAVKL